MRIYTLILMMVVATAAMSAEIPVERAVPRWITDGIVLSDARAAELAESLLPRIAEARAQPRLRPAFGLLISNVSNNSQASAAGIVAGDVITHLDGVQLPDTSSFNLWRKRAAQKVTVWSLSAGERVIEIKPGLVGFSQSMSWSPLHGYLATRKGQSPPWEDDLLLATFAIDFHIRLAERALLRAQDKGCTHPTWMAVAAAVAVQLGRMSEATVYARAALEQVTPLERIPVARLLYLSLMSRGLVAEAQEVTRKFDVVLYEDNHARALKELSAAVEPFRAAAAAHPVISLSDMPRSELVDQSRALLFLSGPQQAIAEELSRLDPDGDLVFQGNERTKRLNGEGKLSFKVRRGRLDLTRMGPVMRDLDMSVNCRLDDDGAEFKTRMGVYAIGIADHAQQGAVLARLRITEDSKIQVRVEGMPEYEINRRPLHIYSEHRLQAIIRDHTLALLVDDLPVYHGPLLADPATRQLGLDLHTRDLQGTWSKLSWRGILAPQELPIPPASVDRPKPPTIGADNFF